MGVGEFINQQKICTKEDLLKHIEVTKKVAELLEGHSFSIEIKIKVNEKIHGTRSKVG